MSGQGLDPRAHTLIQGLLTGPGPSIARHVHPWLHHVWLGLLKPKSARLALETWRRICLREPDYAVKVMMKSKV